MFMLHAVESAQVYLLFYETFLWFLSQNFQKFQRHISLAHSRCFFYRINKIFISLLLLMNFNLMLMEIICLSTPVIQICPLNTHASIQITHAVTCVKPTQQDAVKVPLTTKTILQVSTLGASAIASKISDKEPLPKTLYCLGSGWNFGCILMLLFIAYMHCLQSHTEVFNYTLNE